MCLLTRLFLQLSLGALAFQVHATDVSRSLLDVPAHLCEDALLNGKDAPLPFKVIAEKLFYAIAPTLRLSFFDAPPAGLSSIPKIEELISTGVVVEFEDLEAALEAVWYLREKSYGTKGLAEKVESRFLVKTSNGLTPWKEFFKGRDANGMRQFHMQLGQGHSFTVN